MIAHVVVMYGEYPEEGFQVHRTVFVDELKAIDAGGEMVLIESRKTDMNAMTDPKFQVYKVEVQ